MESLGYVLLYFLKGSLPWRGLKCRPSDKDKEVFEKKRQAAELGLFDSIPIAFKRYFELIRSDDVLDYRGLRRVFRDLFCRMYFEYDYVFDWTILKFLETQEAVRNIK